MALQTIAGMILALSLAPLSDCAVKDTNKNNLRKLAGRWNAQFSFDESGAKVSLEDSDYFMVLVFKEDTLVTLTGKISDGLQKAYKETSRITLDTSKRPKWLDVAVQDGESKGKTFYGIYELDGDSLRICWCSTGRDRPRQFKSNEEQGHNLLSFKRLKPTKSK